MALEYQGREVISPTEAQELTGKSRRTINNWMKKGQVEFVRLPSGAPRIYKDSLFREEKPLIHPDEAPSPESGL